MEALSIEYIGVSLVPTINRRKFTFETLFLCTAEFSCRLTQLCLDSAGWMEALSIEYIGVSLVPGLIQSPSPSP